MNIFNTSCTIIYLELNAVTYINCLTLGGRTGIPDLAMVDTFLKENTVDLDLLHDRREFYKHAVLK